MRFWLAEVAAYGGFWQRTSATAALLIWISDNADADEPTCSECKPAAEARLMTFFKRCFVLFCGLCLMAMAQSPAAQEHAGHLKPATAAPVPAQRWQADASLREGMRRIHDAVEELHRYELGRMNRTSALAHVASIQDAGAFIFTHCKLPPDADAALHGILVPLLGAAQTLSDDPQAIAAVATMRDAVAGYPRYFDDPGWPALTESQPH